MHALSFEPNYGTSNLDFDFNDPDLGGVGLWVYWNSTGSNRITSGASGAYTDGQWHLVALTRSGSTITLYVDGSAVGSTSYSPAIDLNSNLSYIGAGLIGGTTEFFWDGLIDEVEIFNRALSPQEIQDLFNAGSAGKCKKETKKVTICHKPGTPAQKTLVIPVQALAGHLSHGDTIGPCN